MSPADAEHQRHNSNINHVICAKRSEFKPRAAVAAPYRCTRSHQVSTKRLRTSHCRSIRELRQSIAEVQPHSSNRHPHRTFHPLHLRYTPRYTPRCTPHCTLRCTPHCTLRCDPHRCVGGTAPPTCTSSTLTSVPASQSRSPTKRCSARSVSRLLPSNPCRPATHPGPRSPGFSTQRLAVLCSERICMLCHRGIVWPGIEQVYTQGHLRHGGWPQW